MEPISTFLALAAGYILKGAAQSKAADTAKEEFLSSFWQWIRPLFIQDVPEVETHPDAPATEEKVTAKLVDLVKDEGFFQELAKQVSALQQAGVKEKNIVRKDILRVKKIKIGDKEYDPNESYTRKNIVEGSVQDADEFILGDGH
ncbi:MAG: hypothetical protein ACK4TA_08750 [Saprospiraceae bacterium]